jgi:photosystem II stability/assembly factor-like uncharacterized protein
MKKRTFDSFLLGLWVRWVSMGLCLIGFFSLTLSSVSQSQNIRSDWPEVLLKSKAFQRELWFFKQRAFPLGYIPLGARLRALKELERLPKDIRTTQPVQGNVWTSIGPAPMNGGQIGATGGTRPMSGRVADIAVDPTNPGRWLIGAAQGGIWETTNNGTTWTPKTDTQKSLAIGAIAFAPSNPSIIYAGTGEASFSCDAYFGAGLLKSTDGGNTWTLLATSTFGNRSFSDIKVHPTDPNTVLAATTRGVAGRGCDAAPSFPPNGIFKSTDGGVSWTLKLGGAGSSGRGTDLEIDPTNFNNQYAGLGEIFGNAANGVYRSTDGGETWTLISGPWTSPPFSTNGVGRVELAIAPSNPNTLYVSIQDAFNGVGSDGGLLGLWRTDNAWAATPTWIQVPTGATDDGTGTKGYCGWDAAFASFSGQCWYDHEIIVDPTDANTLYAGGIPLWKCTNCSTSPTWTEVSKTVSDPANGIHVDQHTMAWAGSRLIVGNDGGVWSTTDGGNTWNDHNTNLAITQIYDGAVHPTDPNFALEGSQDNGTAKFTGTSAWTWIFGGDGADNAISTSDPNNDWAVSSQYLNIWRTTNGGASWISSTSGIDFTGVPFIARFEKCPSNDDVFIAGTDNVWKSTNFFSAGTPTWSPRGPDPLDPNPPFAAGFGITALAFAPSDPTCNTYAVATETGKIFITTNDGATMNDISAGVPDRYVTDLAFDPTNANILYVTLSGFNEGTPGAPGHVFKTTNATAASPTWSNISPGVNTPHNTIVVDPFNPNVIHVGTDVGILKSADGGNTWSVLATNSGLPNVAVFDLAVSHTSGTLMAFTHGRGAFKVGTQTFGTPTAALMRVERSTGNVYSDGSFNSALGVTSGFNTGIGADIAERIDVSEAVEPGDVVELDPSIPKHYRKARGPYSRLVAGVISTQPGMTLANVRGRTMLALPRGWTLALGLGDSSLRLTKLLESDGQQMPLALGLSVRALLEGNTTSSGLSLSLRKLIDQLPQHLEAQRDSRPLLALLGRVPVKATTENGPIRPGDLLTSASKPGYAMRCVDVTQCEGAIIGKALEALDKGEGVILVLLVR